MTIGRFITVIISIAIVSIPMYLLFSSQSQVDRTISVYSQGSSEPVRVYSGDYRYSTGLNSVKLKNMSTGKSIYIKNAVVIIEDW